MKKDNLERFKELQWELFKQTILENEFIPIDPSPKQVEFLLDDSLEVFYGGAAGGGKTFALLAAALKYVMMPDYHAMLFRKTYPDLSLPGALMDVSYSWLAGKAKWNDVRKMWTFPSGATLSFGYMEHETDKYRYKSSMFQFIGFDELTQFTESQYLYLFSRLRRALQNDIPLRVRSASNPGDVGHAWVKARFIDGKLKSRKFIPARLSDNPFLDRESYVENLNKLDYVTRLQLLEGDWDVTNEGNLFKRHYFEVVDSYPLNCPTVRYWDFAATKEGKKNADPDYTASCKMTEKDGIYYVIDMTRTRGTPFEIERLVKQCAEIDGRETRIVIEQEPGASGVGVIDHYRRNVIPMYDLISSKTSGSKITRARPVSAQAEAGNIKLVKGKWIPDFLDEASSFPFGHDDMVDAVCGAFEHLAKMKASRYFSVIVPDGVERESSWT